MAPSLAGAVEAGAEEDGTSNALTSSPSSARSPMTEFTATFSLPASTRILPITPSSMASTSIVALSVSISAMTSPERTASPSATSQRANVPSVIVGERAGIKISIAMIIDPLHGNKHALQRPRSYLLVAMQVFLDLPRKALAHLRLRHAQQAHPDNQKRHP